MGVVAAQQAVDIAGLADIGCVRIDRIGIVQGK